MQIHSAEVSVYIPESSILVPLRILLMRRRDVYVQNSVSPRMAKVFLLLPHVIPSSLPQSQPLPSSLSHFSSLLETPTCVTCFGPSVFPSPQSGKLAYSHNMGHQKINYTQQAKTTVASTHRVTTNDQSTAASATVKINISKSLSLWLL